MKPRSRYIPHSSSLTHDLSSSRARCSARRSRPGSYAAPAAPARRRAGSMRRVSSRRSIHGMEISHRSARTTIAVAESATITPSLRPAGGPREEDHAAGVARDLVERADHLRLAPPVGPGGRHGRPHSVVELAAELLDERLLLLRDLEVAFGDELLAEAGTHAEELHPGRLYPSRLDGRSGCGPPRRQSEDIDRTGALPQPAEAVPHRLAGDPARRPRGLPRRPAERELRREHRGVGAPGAM